MATPPVRTELADTYPNPSNATFRTGIGKLYDYVTGLLGATGTAADARTAMGVAALAGSAAQVFNAATAVNPEHTTPLAQVQSLIAGRNKIIGGDFSTNPWQRGTSFTALSSGSYCADMWNISNSSAAVADIYKSLDYPAPEVDTATLHCLHVDVTTADASLAAGDRYLLRTPVEGLNAASMGFGRSGTRYVTLTFWHKHTKTGTYCVSLCNSAANRSYVAEYTQATTDTWEQAEITIPVDNAGTWLYDTGIGVYVNFAVAAGTTFQTTAGAWQAGDFAATANQVNALDSASNDFKLALVQLSSGEGAAVFENLSAGEVLALCQRYYRRILAATFPRSYGMGFNETTTTAFALVNLGSMRDAPTSLEQTGTASDYRIDHLSSTVACSSVPTLVHATKYSAKVKFTVASGLTAGQGSECLAATNASYLGFSAEL